MDVPQPIDIMEGQEKAKINSFNMMPSIAGNFEKGSQGLILSPSITTPTLYISTPPISSATLPAGPGFIGNVTSVGTTVGLQPKTLSFVDGNYVGSSQQQLVPNQQQLTDTTSSNDLVFQAIDSHPNFSYIQSNHGNGHASANISQGNISTIKSSNSMLVSQVQQAVLISDATGGKCSVQHGYLRGNCIV